MMTPYRTQPTDAESDLKRGRYWLLLALVVALAGWVRFSGLGDRELWFDENCTYYAVHHLLDWPADGPDPWRELAHLPYVLLLRGWTAIVGESAWGLWSFSAVVGSITVAVLGVVGARVGGRWAGLTAAVLAALHPLHVYYSRQARVYALWMLAVVVCLYLLIRAAQTARARWWLAYACVAWLSVLTHYYTLLWLPATCAVVVIAERRRHCLRQWLVTHVGLGAGLFPIVWFLVRPLAAGGPKPWLRAVWQGYPPLLAVPKSLWAMLPSGGYPRYLESLGVVGQAARQFAGEAVTLIIAWGPIACLGLLVVLRFIVSQPSVMRRITAVEVSCATDGRTSAPARSTTECSRLIFCLLLVSGLFLLIAWLYAWWRGYGYVVGRYDVAAWPGLVLGIALLIEQVAVRMPRPAWSHVMRAAVVVCLVSCSVMTVATARAVPVQGRLTERAKRVAAQVGLDDLVISLGMYRWFVTYPWQQIGFTAEVVSFPSWHDRQLCWYDAEAELAKPQAVAADVAATVGRINRALDRGRRVWLLAHGEPAGARWEVDSRLFAALRREGIEVHLRDEEAGLAELVRQASS